MTEDKKDAARAKSRERQGKLRERKQADKCQVKPTKSLTRSETDKPEKIKRIQQSEEKRGKSKHVFTKAEKDK